VKVPNIQKEEKGTQCKYRTYKRKRKEHSASTEHTEGSERNAVQVPNRQKEAKGTQCKYRTGRRKRKERSESTKHTESKLRKNLTVESSLQNNILDDRQNIEGRISKCCVINLNFTANKGTSE